MSRDQFHSESGDEFDFEVHDAYFAIVPNYREGRDWFLHLTGKSSRESQPIMGREDYHPSWRLGDDWESLDGGKTVTHPTKKMFHSMTPAGEFIDNIAKIIPEGTPDDPLENANPLAADWLVGLKFHFSNETRKFKLGDGREVESQRLVPTAYLGRVDVSASALPATPPAAAKAESSPDLNGVKGKLTALAISSPDFPTFRTAAVALEEVVQDSTLLASVLEEGPTGFYATARA